MKRMLQHFSFKQRLLKRNYPKEFTNKVTPTIQYSHRQKFLQSRQIQQPRTSPPLYKCLPPPQFRLLKQLVLQDYRTLHFTSPRFIALQHQTLQNTLVRTRQLLTATQFIDVTLTLDTSPQITHTETVTLLSFYSTPRSITPCKQPRCLTCQLHLNCSPTFRSNHPRHRNTYSIRHSFSYQRHLCHHMHKKQYVGCTTTQLNTRINHHCTSINCKKSTYITNISTSQTTQLPICQYNQLILQPILRIHKNFMT